MDNVFIFALIISIAFFIVKFAEMRFVEKESKPLKFLLRDTLIVYFCVISGNFVFDQLKPVINNTGLSSQPSVFTDNPSF
jgi:hypothetical protein